MLKPICYYPFLSIYIDSSGEVFFCCVYKKSLGNMNKNSLNDIFKNSKKIIYKVRKKLSEGRYPIGCIKCKKLKDAGIKNDADKSHEIYNNSDKENISLNYGITNIIELMISISNLCNLKCIMCSGSESSSFKNSIYKFIDIKKLDISLLSNLKKIYIKGGEPFLEKKHFELLDILINSNLSKKEELSYTTNLLILPGINGYDHLLPKGYKNIFNLWERFNFVFINISCDGYGDVYEKIRIGAKWDIFKKNLIEFIKLSNKYENIKIKIRITIQKDNIYNIPLLIIFLLKVGIDYKIGFVRKPERLNIKTLDILDKIKIIKFYKSLLLKKNDNINFKESLSNILKWMNS